MDKLKITWHGVELEVKGTFTKGYPAPYSSGDHDSPNFSDPGEQESYVIDEILWENRHGIKMYVTDLLMPNFEDEIEELCINAVIEDSASDDREKGED